MPKRVYIETTIPSYLAASPGRDLIQAARQQLTHEWWNERRQLYDLCVSQMVVDEVSAGDPETARKRLDFVTGLPLLDLNSDVDELAEAILASGLLPEQAARDAVHIAAATVHEVDVLLTWNCRHIANAAIMKRLRELAARHGFELPVLCTPEELFEE